MSTFSCPCGGSCACHGGNGAYRPPCNIPGGCGSVSIDDAPSSGLCVLGCADRSRTDVWPRPPRPREDGKLTCRPCSDRILTTLDEVLELAVHLDLVAAAGSAPASGEGGRKRIKDEPVAPVPASIPTAALTDVRSRRGAWVPDAVPVADDRHDDDAELHDDLLANLTAAQAAAAGQRLDEAIAVFGARSDQARAAAADLERARRRLAAVQRPRIPRPRGIDPRDGASASVVGFLDHWTDQVRIGRGLLGAGTCPAYMLTTIPLRTGPFGGIQDWPHTVVCHRPTEYRRLIRIEMGAHSTGLFAVCAAGHITRPAGQGDQPIAQRAGHGHRPVRGVRHGLTYLAAVGLLRTHNDWICDQGWVGDYWRGLRELRADLGRAHGEQRPARIGNCPNATGETDEQGRDVVCGQPLYASPYSDTIECPRCGRAWTHREWRFLGRTLGVIA